jgi:type IV fimbrial biogenesis protein FimT
MKHSAGFTLVELIITVTILGILMAVGMPSFTNFIRNSQIRSAAENLQAGLNLARSESLRRNARVSFWMVSDLTAACARGATRTSWVVSMANPAGACNAASSETNAPQLIQSRSGSDNTATVTLSATDSAGAASSCITFNGFGQVESTCTGGGNPIAKVVLNSSGGTSGIRTLEVRVTSGGAIRLCDPSASSSSPAYCGT